MIINTIRWILLPFSLIYQSIIWLRNRLYDLSIFKSKAYQIPTIVIGNLAIGGAGKSPMTEFLIKLFKDKYNLAILSRGYGRKTKGFLHVNIDSNAIEVGDEPLQFKKKFPDITVAVCENRCFGIEQLSTKQNLIILDDAYQHRKLQAGFYILLFDFNSLFEPFLPLPTGNFRDIFSSSKRANLIVITKCPKNISTEQRSFIKNKISKYTSAPIFYSTIQYLNAIASHDKNKIDNLNDYDIVLLCGIANPKPLVKYIKGLGNRVTLIKYPDHHNYSENDLQKVIDVYHSVSSKKKIILTTEKDVQRINKELFKTIPLYYIPIEIKIEDNLTFEENIKQYLSKNNSVKQY